MSFKSQYEFIPISINMTWNIGDEVEVAGKTFNIIEIDWTAPSGPFYRLNDQTWVNSMALKLPNNIHKEETKFWSDPPCHCGSKFVPGFEGLHSNYCPRFKG